MRTDYRVDDLVCGYEFEAIEATMRVSDRVLKCVVFIGTGKGEKFKPLGTGFLIRVQYKAAEFPYVVTAMHVLEGAKDEITIRLNKRNGEPDFMVPPRGWYYHPDHGRYVDVAVAPIIANPYTHDVIAVRTYEFCKETTVVARDIGIGEELFYPSLFLHHRGRGRNHPVMRFGTLAAMPIEPVITKSGPIKAYLMEGRSIGGHSGAPVFVNFFAPRTYHHERPVPLPTPAEAAMPYRLLGLLRSYLKAKDSGEYLTDEPTTEDLWINSGISTIVPADEIIEVLMQSDLTELRMADEKRLVEGLDVPTAGRVTDDSGASADDANPNHLADFTRLVDVAARKRTQGDQT
jgi:hypothetical protein